MSLTLLAQQTVDAEWGEAAVLAILFLGIFSWVGRSMATDSDRAWLPRFVILGLMAKLVGSVARFWMVTSLYETGDSIRYHEAGRAMASVWRTLAVPATAASGAEGTIFTEKVTGFVYAIYTPSFLGGFLMFAIISFVGQLLFYAAFRPWFQERKQRLYALAIFFLPSMVFWPSSLGKDAVMVFALGLAAYGGSRLLYTHKYSSALIIAPGLYIAASIRPHVAGIAALAIFLGLVLGRSPEHIRGSFKKPLLILASALGAALVLTAFSATFQVGLTDERGSQDIGGFLEDVSEQTATGGSQIDGAAVSSPAQLPLATITVLFRPLLHEGANAQMIMSALEGTALLILTVVRLPQIWRNRALMRRKAYVMFCFFYTGGFIVGFSAILNLGILARQRVQVLPMFLAFLVAMAWPEPPDVESELMDAPASGPWPEVLPRWVNAEVARSGEGPQKDHA